MSSCEPLLNDSFPCLPTSFVGWSSLAYILLPLNILIYDLEQLYLFNCNCFKYHPPFSNSFQTGIYSYILSILSILHAFGSFECHGCKSQSNLTCQIDIIALYAIYSMLAMFSWIRLYSQYKIKSYYNVPTSPSSPSHASRIQATKNAKRIHTILFNAKCHWFSTFIAIAIALALGIVSAILIGESYQLYISGTIYGFSYISFFLCELLIRKKFNIEPDDDEMSIFDHHKTNSNHNHGHYNHKSPTTPRSIRLSSTGSSYNNGHKYLSLGLFEIRTENKKAIFALIFIIIAGCGLTIDQLNIDKTCMKIGHGIYHIFTAIALTFWYWSLVGEKWIFKTPDSLLKDNNIIIHHLANGTQPNSPSVGSGGTATQSEIVSMDTSLRNHILNINHSGSNGTNYSIGNIHDIRTSQLNAIGMNMNLQIDNTGIEMMEYQHHHHNGKHHIPQMSNESDLNQTPKSTEPKRGPKRGKGGRSSFID